MEETKRGKRSVVCGSGMLRFAWYMHLHLRNGPRECNANKQWDFFKYLGAIDTR